MLRTTNGKLARANWDRLWAILTIVGGLSLCGFAQGEKESQRKPLPVGPGPVKLTLDDVQDRLKAVDGMAQLDEAAREELRSVYQDAVRDLTAAGEFQKRAEEYATMSQGAAENLRSAKEQQSVKLQKKPVDVPADANMAALKRELDAAKQELEAAEQRADALRAEPGRRQGRLSEISETTRTVSESRQRLAAESGALGAPSDAKSAAAAFMRQAKIQSLDAELSLHEQERAAYAATAELLTIEIELAERQVSLATDRVAQWDRIVESRRTIEADQQRMKARLEAERATGELRTLANRNSQLAEEGALLDKNIKTVKADLETSTQQLEQLQEQFKITCRKIDRVGLNYANGLLLRREDAALPDVRKYRLRSREREETIRGVELRMIDLEVDRLRLSEEDYVDNFISGVETAPSGITPEQLRREVQRLVDAQQEHLKTLQRYQTSYFEQLVELETTERLLRTAASEYAQYIDERVLWIRSSEPLSVSDVRRSVESLKTFVDWSNWKLAWTGLQQRCVDRYSFMLPIALAWFVLLASQKYLRSEIVRRGAQAASGSCRSLIPTLSSLVMTTLITVLWPALLFILGRLLAAAADHYSISLGSGLRVAGIYYVMLEFMRQVCRMKGLADSHFGWPVVVRTTLRKNLRWFMVVSVPLVFVASVLYADAGLCSQDMVGVARALESAARLFVLANLITAGLFAHQVLRPAGPLYESLPQASHAGNVYRMRRGIYFSVQLLLGSLLVLAFVGYDFTVSQLSGKLYASILLVEVLVISVAIADRWLVVVRRRMAIEQAQQRHAQMDQQAEGGAAAMVSIAIAEEAPDLTAIDQQSRRLVKSLVVLFGLAGLWYVWVDVIPALSFLERVVLWTVTSGASSVVVTLNDAIIAAFVVAVTILATRNIPGLLEIAVLPRLPLDAANRYAIITICRYVLTIVGIVIAFGAIGVHWSQVQWLAAAATVGLGFGLQEIFANFVSGLIVLFEQPIRVGDIVTIGDVTGVVSKIRMRATTVTNWDRQEFIVPNREFITGRLLNWTLSNTVNRVVITVGVAYGTDPDEVKRLMLEIANEHSVVLDDPGANVTFEQFGDSTLNVVMRCYLPDMENRLSTIHELNTEVQRKLNDAGIEFAFPTRELYIRSSITASEPQGVSEVDAEGGSGATV